MSIVLPPIEYMHLVCGTKANVEDVFIKSGELQADRLKKYNLYNENTKILDIGCGCGRFARHLVDSPIQKYVGFDRHPGMIKWATDNITKISSKIQFKHIDLASPYDEVDGHVGNIDASRFRFPFEDNSFNVVNLASVFTHMPFNEVEHYLKEMNRVVEPGGIALFTIFFTEKPQYNIGYNYYFNLKDIKKILENNGWQLDKNSSSKFDNVDVLFDNCQQNWLCAINVQS